MQEGSEKYEVLEGDGVTIHQYNGFKVIFRDGVDNQPGTCNINLQAGAFNSDSKVGDFYYLTRQSDKKKFYIRGNRMYYHI